MLARPGARPGGRCRSAALEARVDIRRSPLELLLKVLDVDGAVECVQGGWVGDRAARGPTTPSATTGSPRPAAAEQDAMLGLRAADDVPDGVPDRRTRRPARRPLRALRRLRRRLVSRPTIAAATQAARQGALDRVGVAARAAGAVADRARPARRPGRRRAASAGKIAAGEQVRTGRVRRAAHRSRLGRRRCASCSRRTADGRPVDAEVPRGAGPGVRLGCCAGWDWERASGRRRVGAEPEPAAAGRVAGHRASPPPDACDLLGPAGAWPRRATPLAASTNSAYRVRDLWGRFRVRPRWPTRWPGSGAGAAGRRPGRLALDDDRGRTPPAPRRGPRVLPFALGTY